MDIVICGLGAELTGFFFVKYNTYVFIYRVDIVLESVHICACFCHERVRSSILY